MHGRVPDFDADLKTFNDAIESQNFELLFAVQNVDDEIERLYDWIDQHSKLDTTIAKIKKRHGDLPDHFELSDSTKALLTKKSDLKKQFFPDLQDEKDDDDPALIKKMEEKLSQLTAKIREAESTLEKYDQKLDALRYNSGLFQPGKKYNNERDQFILKALTLLTSEEDSKLYRSLLLDDYTKLEEKFNAILNTSFFNFNSYDSGNLFLNRAKAPAKISNPKAPVPAYIIKLEEKKSDQLALAQSEELYENFKKIAKQAKEASERELVTFTETHQKIEAEKQNNYILLDKLVSAPSEATNSYEKYKNRLAAMEKKQRSLEQRRDELKKFNEVFSDFLAIESEFKQKKPSEISVDKLSLSSTDLDSAEQKNIINTDTVKKHLALLSEIESKLLNVCTQLNEFKKNPYISKQECSAHLQKLLEFDENLQSRKAEFAQLGKKLARQYKEIQRFKLQKQYQNIYDVFKELKANIDDTPDITTTPILWDENTDFELAEQQNKANVLINQKRAETLTEFGVTVKYIVRLYTEIKDEDNVLGSGIIEGAIGKTRKLNKSIDGKFDDHKKEMLRLQQENDRIQTIKGHKKEFDEIKKRLGKLIQNIEEITKKFKEPEIQKTYDLNKKIENYHIALEGIKKEKENLNLIQKEYGNLCALLENIKKEQGNGRFISQMALEETWKKGTVFEKGVGSLAQLYDNARQSIVRQADLDLNRQLKHLEDDCKDQETILAKLDDTNDFFFHDKGPIIGAQEKTNFYKSSRVAHRLHKAPQMPSIETDLKALEAEAGKFGVKLDPTSLKTSLKSAKALFATKKQEWEGFLATQKKLIEAKSEESKIDLRDRHFDGLRLKAKRLSKQHDLRGTTFNGAVVEATTIACSLTNVDFSGADLRGATFTKDTDFKGIGFDADTQLNWIDSKSETAIKLLMDNLSDPHFGNGRYDPNSPQSGPQYLINLIAFIPQINDGPFTASLVMDLLRKINSSSVPNTMDSAEHLFAQKERVKFIFQHVVPRITSLEEMAKFYQLIQKKDNHATSYAFIRKRQKYTVGGLYQYSDTKTWNFVIKQIQEHAVRLAYGEDKAINKHITSGAKDNLENLINYHRDAALPPFVYKESQNIQTLAAQLKTAGAASPRGPGFLSIFHKKGKYYYHELFSNAIALLNDPNITDAQIKSIIENIKLLDEQFKRPGQMESDSSVFIMTDICRLILKYRQINEEENRSLHTVTNLNLPDRPVNNTNQLEIWKNALQIPLNQKEKLAKEKEDIRDNIEFCYKGLCSDYSGLPTLSLDHLFKNEITLRPPSRPGTGHYGH